MAEESRTSWLLPTTGLAFLASVFTGVLFKTGPADPKLLGGASQVSTAPGEPGDDAGGGQNNVTCRLWDDPLVAAKALDYYPFKGTLEQQWKMEGIVETPKTIPEIGSNKLKDGHIIFIPMVGLRYPDVAENRRQQRYAVQAAMWSKGYTPKSANLLSLADFSFDVVFGEDKDRKKLPGRNWYYRVPYEDYEAGEGSVLPPVRVCYLNLDKLNQRILFSVRQIASEMTSNSAISIATPPSTNWLMAILPSEKIKNTAAAVSKADEKICVFNTLATGLNSNAAKDTPLEAEAYTHENEIKNIPVLFRNLISNDKDTIELITKELEVRRTEAMTLKPHWLWGSPCKVALITEGETTFGAKFREFFEQTLPKDATTEDKLPLRTYYYLRGISGVTPEGRATRAFIDRPSQRAAETGTPGEALSRAIEPGFMPPPFGPSQFDYIARLGEKIAVEQKWMRMHGQGEFQAFVLIGTDVDDKLALLKVLRPRFPSALFFTNEMDAEYLQPENREITRNLLAVTRYGLDDEYLQNEIREEAHNSPSDGKSGSKTRNPGTMPVFRRSSQLAMMDSIRAAIDCNKNETRCQENTAAPSCRKLRKAKIYEVGLQREHLLASDSTRFNKQNRDEGSLRWPTFLMPSGACLLCIAAVLTFLKIRKSRAPGDDAEIDLPKSGEPAVKAVCFTEQIYADALKSGETVKAVCFTEQIYADALKSGEKWNLSIVRPSGPDRNARLWAWPVGSFVLGLAGLIVWADEKLVLRSWLCVLCVVLGAGWLLARPRVLHRHKVGWVLIFAMPVAFALMLRRLGLSPWLLALVWSITVAAFPFFWRIIEKRRQIPKGTSLKLGVLGALGILCAQGIIQIMHFSMAKFAAIPRSGPVAEFSSLSRGWLSLADGVCLLPSLALRLFAAVLALWLLRRGYCRIIELRRVITFDYFLESEGGKPGGIMLGDRRPEAGFTGIGYALREFPKTGELDQPNAGEPASRSKLEQENVPPRNEAEEWNAYLLDSHPMRRMLWRRLRLWPLVAACLTMVVMLLLGFPRANIRGAPEKTMDVLFMMLSLGSLAVLCIFVCDQFRRCQLFIAKFYRKARTSLGFEFEETMHLIGKLTGEIGKLLLHPFLVCMVLLAAHSGMFIQWFDVGGLYALIFLALGAPMLMAWCMQVTAQGIKSAAISSLRLQLAEALWMKRLLLQRLDHGGNRTPEESKLWWKYTISRIARHQTMPEIPRTVELHERGGTNETDPGPELTGARAADIAFQEARVERLSRLIEIVQGIRDGAFGGLKDNPIFHSILIPGIGLGGFQLIQRLMNG